MEHKSIKKKRMRDGRMEYWMFHLEHCTLNVPSLIYCNSALRYSTCIIKIIFSLLLYNVSVSISHRPTQHSLSPYPKFYRLCRQVANLESIKNVNIYPFSNFFSCLQKIVLTRKYYLENNQALGSFQGFWLYRQSRQLARAHTLDM